jgi:hypothetical protein
LAKNILIVEDSAAMRSMIDSILGETVGEEFLITEAQNGFEALKLLPRIQFDLILTDIKAAGGTIQPHAGDANNDGAVNVGDLGILAANWNGTGKVWATGDFTGEGSVNVGDLGVLAANWGWTGAPADPGSIPEPASLILLGLGALAMLRRRR